MIWLSKPDDECRPAELDYRGAVLITGGGSAAGQPQSLVHSVRLAFAHSSRTVFYIMAGVMAVIVIIAVRWLPPGQVQAPEEALAADPAAGPTAHGAGP